MAQMIPSNTQKRATDGDRSIGGRIALLRAARGMSQTALGQALGVSFQQVQKYEKGRNRVGAGRLQAIADHLGVPVSSFYDAPAADESGRETVENFLQDRDVLDLVRTFTAISDKAVRASVLAIVKAAASLQAAEVGIPDGESLTKRPGHRCGERVESREPGVL